MNDIHDKSIDMILCDLPYGCTACKWDIVLPFEKLWEQYNRVIKDNSPIILFGIEPFSSIIRMSNINNYKHEWYWNKELAGNFIQAKNHPLKVIENIIVFSNKKVNYYPQMELAKDKNKRDTNKTMKNEQKTEYLGKVSNGMFAVSKSRNENLRYPKNLITYNSRNKECNNTKRVHPTQKPVELLEYLIKTYSRENYVVLDNCMGSGSTGVAALNLHRKFIGIELDKKYYEIAENRIKAVEMSLLLGYFREYLKGGKLGNIKKNCK